MRYLAVLALVLPSAAMAAGSGSSTPPVQPACEAGKVRDAASGACVDKSSHLLDDAERLQAVREYAYAGQNRLAQQVLDAMDDQQADGVLTYRGFTARQLGNLSEAMDWYKLALDINPDNLLTRSYMGLGFVEQGQDDLARAQLSEIRARGGRGTWAEASLRLALDTGVTKGY